VDFGEAALEEGAIGGVAGEGQRVLVGRGGFWEVTEAAQEVGAGGVEEVVRR
jgi:hypothetical protein